MGYQTTKRTTISSQYWKDTALDIAISKDGKPLTIGWKRIADGTYEMVADWYRTGINQKQFVKDVKVGHTKHKASAWLAKQGYSIKYEIDAEGDTVVVGTRW